MDEREHDPAKVLAYGTHDRAGPWWRRWLRAGWRATQPALIAALIVAALAYSVAPRQYTAVATVEVEPDVISVARGTASSPATDAARADALARSLKNTDYLQQVLTSPQWRAARLRYSGETAFAPIDAQVIPGTKTVRICFTDPKPQAARIGAEAAVAALRPVDGNSENPAVLVERTLGPLIEQERRLRLQVVEERERGSIAAPPPLTNTTAQRRPPSLERQLVATSRRLALAERQLANVPRVTRGRPVAAPRFASNQKELAVTAIAAAGLVFPLALLVAVYHSWRYGGATTTQATAPDRILTITDLANLLAHVPMRPWRAAARQALGPAVVAAGIAGAVACCFAPRQYTATATLAAAPAPAPTSTAPAAAAAATAPTSPAAAVTPGAALAEVAAAARAPNVLEQVLGSGQWKAVRGEAAQTSPASGRAAPTIEVSSDARSVVVRFTDGDRAAARYGAEAAMTAARAAVTGRAGRARWQRTQLLQVQQLQQLQQLQRIRQVKARQAPTGTGSGALEDLAARLEKELGDVPEAAAVARADAIRLAVAQFPAAVTSESWWPSNQGELFAAAVTPAAWAFGVVFLIAVLWNHRRAVLRCAGDDPQARRAARLNVPPSGFGGAAAAAILVGLVGYTVTTRTYTASATLSVSVGAADAADAAGRVPASPVVVSRVEAELMCMVRGADIETDFDAGTIAVRYTGLDREVASASANAIASLLASTCRTAMDQRDLRMLFRATPSDARARDPHTPGELAEWSTASAGLRVDVLRPATPPRWRDQFQPLKTAALAAACTFPAVVLCLELLLGCRRPVVPTATRAALTQERGSSA